MRRIISPFVIWALGCALWASSAGAADTVTDPSGPTIGHELPKPGVRFVTKTGDATNTTVNTSPLGLGTFPVPPFSSTRYGKMVVTSAVGTTTATYSPGANPNSHFPDWDITYTGAYGAGHYLGWDVTTAFGPNMTLFLANATSKSPTSVTIPADAPENFVTWVLSNPLPGNTTRTTTTMTRGSSEFVDGEPLASFSGNQRQDSHYKLVASSALAGTKVA